MQPISRRTMLAASAATVAVGAIASCSDDGGGAAPPTEPAVSEPPRTDPAATDAPTTTATPPSTFPTLDIEGDPFTLGVASGDPDASSVVLWTRLAPVPLDGGGMPADDVPVVWEVAADDTFAAIVASGEAIATAADGHTVHALAELGGLPGSADAWWYYRFRAGQYTSPTGRTRVAPAAGTAVAEARLATASCQHYGHGYYAAHRDLAAQQPDLVLWLGDYIYEGAGEWDAGTEARSHNGPEPVTLDDYRNRYGLYKRDPDLQAAHATCPWFVIWDDHEVENNYAGLVPQDAPDAAAFAERRAAAYKAWWEHQPTRLPAPTGPDYQIYRRAEWGDLLTFAMLDGRQYRSDQACGDATLSLDPPCPEVTEPGRTMLGDEQEQWLYETLDGSTAIWKCIGNQVILADATFNGAILNYDQWDGYPEQRARILQHLADVAASNVVVVTGDIHLAAVAQLRAGERGAGTPVGVEFVTTSISSDGLVGDELTDVLKSFPDLLDAELAHRGYTLHTVTPERWTAEYRIVADVDEPESSVSVYGSYVVEAGSNTVAPA